MPSDGPLLGKLQTEEGFEGLAGLELEINFVLAYFSSSGYAE